MNSFLRSRSCRCCVCLILVLVLLISWSPIRAQASVLGTTATAAALFGDDAIAIILAVIGGLGVCAYADSEVSDLEARSLALSAMDAMEEAGKFVKDGALSVYTSLSEAWSYAVSTDLVQWLHDWLWTESGVMNPLCNSLTSEQIAALDGHMSAFCSAFGVSVVYGCYVDTGTGFQFALSKAPIILSGTVYKPSDGSVMWSLYATGTNTVIKQDGIILQFNPSGRTVHTFSGGSCVGLNADVEQKSGVVAPPGTEIETEYGEYVVIVAPNGVPDTGGDGGDDEQPKIPVLPVPYLPPSEIPNVPQEDIWKGNKVEIDNPDTGDTRDPTTGTDTDDPDSGSNNPTTPNPDPGTNPGTGVPSDIGKYQIDLKDFFPFCIPFDLYRFFEILCAEPEAPVFHWEFNVFGELHSLDVDLSPWNSHAQLFRDAQVGLFIMGLLWITRKFIKW